MSVTEISFWTTGEDFTRTVRDLWNSNMVKTAVEVCTDCGLSVEIAINVCTGKMKFVGDTREGDHTLYVTEDNTKVFFTIEKQIEIHEEKFKTLLDCNVKLQRDLKLSKLPTGKAASFRANKIGGITEYQRTEWKIKENRDQLKKLIGGLNFLYPLIDKTIADLPVSEIGGLYFTDPEVKEIELAYTTLERNKKIREEEKKKKEEEKRIPPKPEFREAKEDDPHGWIDRNGKIYPCGFEEHIYLSECMQFHKIIPENVNAEKWLEEQGWLKVSSYRFSFYPESRNIKLTKKQKDVIMLIWSKNKSVYKNKYEYNYRDFDTLECALKYISKSGDSEEDDE